MTTNKPGSADPETSNRSVPLPVLLAGLAAVLFAVFIGSQVLPVLYAILVPPPAPTPDNLTLMSHTSQDSGSDEWVYNSTQSACELVTFYQQKDGDCQIAPECNPASSAPTTASSLGQRVSQCTGIMKFASFAMRWQATITPLFDDKAELRLTRQLLWSGAVPTITSQPEATP